MVSSAFQAHLKRVQLAWSFGASASRLFQPFDDAELGVCAHFDEFFCIIISAGIFFSPELTCMILRKFLSVLVHSKPSSPQ